MIGLRITNGTTTIDLNGGDPWEVIELDLGYGDPSEKESSGSVRLLINGQGASMPVGGAIDFISQSVQALQQLIQQGINYWHNDKGAAIKDAYGSIVYLEYRSKATDDYYRSPITQARYTMPNETTWGISVGTAEVEYVVDFVRKNWWEGTEVQIALHTSLQADTTGYATVYNPKPCLFDDSTIDGISFEETGGQYFINDTANRLDRFHLGGNVAVRGSLLNDGDYSIIAKSAAQLEVFQPIVDESVSATDQAVWLMGSEETEYVGIDAGDVIGDLPAAVRLAFKNTYTDDLIDLWVGHWFTDITGAPIVYEGEAGNYDYVDDLISDDLPPPSGGYLIEYDEPFPIAAPIELVPITWNLDTGSLGSYNARYFKAVLKLYDNSGAPNNYNYQMRLKRNTTIIWEGPIVRYGGYPKGSSTGDPVPLARDIGTFRIPPQFKAIPSMQGLVLELVLTPYDNTVGAVSGIKIDYLMIFPVDGFRYLQSVAGVAQDSVIYDDGYQNYAYVITSSGKGEGDVIGYGNQIMLQPGISQRLYFFQGTDLFRTGDVKLYYRPRRLSL